MSRRWRTMGFCALSAGALLAAGHAALRAQEHPPDRLPLAAPGALDGKDQKPDESEAAGRSRIPGAASETAPVEPEGETDESGDASSDKKDSKKDESKEKPKPKKAPPNPFKPNLWQNDFSYKREPGNTTYIPGEELKDIPLPCLDEICGLKKSKLSVGGEVRHRYMDEDNRLRLGGPGRSTYDLWRLRNYVDYDSELVRVYVESIDASSFGEELPEQIIDVNRLDLQNAFVDLKFAERDGKPIVFRTGRMELQYGSQHLISPLDWANTRRNFEGFLISSKGDTWDIDAFTTRPVNSAALNKFRKTSFDHPDSSKTFSGVYSTFHGVENHTVDVYWIWLREQEPRALLPDGSRQTVGLRWAGTHSIKHGGETVLRQWDWDFEGGYQYGHDNDLRNIERPIEAGFLSANLGHTWTAAPWSPKLSAIYYWGSGDRDRFDDEAGTFSVLYPLNHAYWGILDNLSGQNLIDYGVQAQVKPSAKLTGVAAMHWFNLDTTEDTVYTVAGVSTGRRGTSSGVGRELDLIGTYNFCANFDVQVGMSWFWYGDAIARTTLRRDDATQFYVQSTLRY